MGQGRGRKRREERGSEKDERRQDIRYYPLRHPRRWGMMEREGGQKRLHFLRRARSRWAEMKKGFRFPVVLRGSVAVLYI
jgi:hypothetical protein